VECTKSLIERKARLLTLAMLLLAAGVGLVAVGIPIQ